MSVLIKGMKMPKAGQSIEIAEGMTGIIYGRLTPSLDDEWHEVIEVPPHGDLINREYAIAAACSGRIRTLPTTGDGEDWIRVKEVLESIKAAPTIIPAEEGE